MNKCLKGVGLALLAISQLGCPADSPESVASKTSANAEVVELSVQPNTPATEGKQPESPGTRSPDNTSPEASESTNLTIRVLSWNVESEGSDDQVIASQIQEMEPADIYALSEVLPQSFESYRAACGKGFESVNSQTGFNDRLQIIFSSRFSLVRQLELHEINNDRHRSPLVVHLKENVSGLEFLVMNNHLARGNAEFRQEQARKLVEWARDQTLPILAVGDYNFDYVFETQTGNPAFNNFLRDNIWEWVKPGKLIDTNWYDPEPDGVDNYPGSMLDFAFVAGPAKNWDNVCNVIVRTGDFPDDEKTSDHRPFVLVSSVNRER